MCGHFDPLVLPVLRKGRSAQHTHQDSEESSHRFSRTKHLSADIILSIRHKWVGSRSYRGYSMQASPEKRRYCTCGVLVRDMSGYATTQELPCRCPN